MRAIIPAAGFGTRMNMRLDQSKEMLPDPSNSGRDHIIDHSLKLCSLMYLDPLVIVRKEKQDLIKYLQSLEVEYLVIETRGEWPDTVIESQFHWHDDNILILPDTRFNPARKAIMDIQNGLELGNNAVFALHQVTDPEKWGIISDYRVFDKPKHLQGEQWAWGLIGFTAEYGEQIFNTLDNNDKDKIQLRNVGFTYLNSFKDITRGKK